MKEYKENTAPTNPENKITYHFNYENFTELFSDIKKALISIVK